MKKKFFKYSTAITFALFAILLIPFFSCDQVVEKRYRIAIDSTWYPLDVHEKAPSLVAYSIELLSKIAVMENLKVELFSVSSGTLFSGLEQDNYDAVFSALSPTSENKKKYLFSDPFYSIGPVVLVRDTSEINDMVQLDGKIIGVQTGDPLVFKLDKMPNLLIKSYDQMQDAFSDVESDVIDGLIVDHIRAATYVTGLYAGRLKIITYPMNDAGLRLVAKNTERAAVLIEHFNDGLRAIRKKDELAPLISKWGLFPLSNYD